MRLFARFMSALLVATLVLPALGVGSVFAAADALAFISLPASASAGVPTTVTVEAQDTGVIDPPVHGHGHPRHRRRGRRRDPREPHLRRR